MIQIACFPEDLILPIIYALQPHHVLRTVPIVRLMPTQSELIPAILDHYRHRRRMTDAENALPYGITFAGSDTIYITNGHHRWYVCRELGRQRLRMWVHFHPMPLREAIVATFCKPAPAPLPKPKRTPRQPVPTVRARQLPLLAAY